MARNKYPEETVEKILQVSMRLFVEQGYEKTSIQDITDNLGGLTKGAIYHHFKSKEDIMLAVLERQFEEHDAKWMDLLRSNNGMTGKEKLRKMFRISVDSPRQENVFRSAPSMLDNPKMLILQLESIMAESAPQFIQPIIELGVRDGSLKTDHPQQLAEVILLLLNLWITPMVFRASAEELEARLELFGQMLEPFDANFLDDELRERFGALVAMYSEKD